MGILDELIEKKDLTAYIHYRKRYLSNMMEKIYMGEENPKRRELIKQRFVGRIKELQLLKKFIFHGTLRDMSKKFARKTGETNVLSKRV